MNRKSEMDAELRSLLERGKVIRRVPDAVRTRVLSRARAVATAGAAGSAASSTPARKPWFVAALVAAIALVVGAAAAAVVLQARGPAPGDTPPSLPPADGTRQLAPPPSLAPAAATLAAPSAPVPATELPSRDAPAHGSPVPKSAAAAPAAQAKESYQAELDLLQRAQAAYVSRDYPSALILAAEHTRRFPHGRLTEEREALRVRSLAGSGRMDEARRAVEAFAEHFPRSVLLPRLQKVVGAP